MISSYPLFIGVTKRRKCTIGNKRIGWMTYLSFHKVRLSLNYEELLSNNYMGIKKGDTLRFYHPNLTTALSSVANAANHMRSFKKGSTTSGDKHEVFGGIIFTSFGRGEPLFGQPNVDSSPFLDNCPSMTLGGTYSGWVLGRGDLNMYATESREEKAVRSFMHECGSVCLIMSYTG
ncbi:hypothetical protein HanIR_Chr04g0156981 [Helianthus annuus]|nr:hypothetical protein HanIR_Chr04g0156981 [Helianthus annuus]